MKGSCWHIMKRKTRDLEITKALQDSIKFPTKEAWVWNERQKSNIQPLNDVLLT